MPEEIINNGRNRMSNNLLCYWRNRSYLSIFIRITDFRRKSLIVIDQQQVKLITNKPLARAIPIDFPKSSLQWLILVKFHLQSLSSKYRSNKVSISWHRHWLQASEVWSRLWNSSCLDKSCHERTNLRNNYCRRIFLSSADLVNSMRCALNTWPPLVNIYWWSISHYLTSIVL
jgi:hypothetical protein